MASSKYTFLDFAQEIPQEKQILFSMQYNLVKKEPTIAVFFGGIGMHKFYMGQIGLGILYIIFFWTFIPLAISLIEVFLISGQVARYNQQKATEIALMLGVTSSNAPTLSKTIQPKFCPNCGKEINP